MLRQLISRYRLWLFHTEGKRTDEPRIERVLTLDAQCGEEGR